jgi:hypothetical protein
LVADIRQFYANPAAPDALKAKPERWAKLQTVLAELKPAGTPPPFLPQSPQQ